MSHITADYGAFDVFDSPAQPNTSPITPEALKALGVQTLSEWEAKRTEGHSATLPAPHKVIEKALDKYLLGADHASRPIHGQTVPAIATPPSRPVPVPIGGPRSTEHIQRLYQVCQLRGIVPKFQYERAGLQWIVLLKLGEDVVVEGDGFFANHQEGKESCAKKGCEIMERWPETGRLRSLGDYENVEEQEPGENWVGLLTQFGQSAVHAPPLYQAYQLGVQTFGTTAVLPSLPSAPVFGNPNIAFTSKKAAKAAAAREAVSWLRANGHIPTEGGVLTRKPLRVLKDLGSLAERLTTGSTGKEIASGENVDVPVSYSQQAHTLREQLGLPTPVYHLGAAPGTVLYSGYVLFETRGNIVMPAILRGRLAEVKDVFGKKNAKEECARGLVLLLRTVLREAGAERHNVSVDLSL